MISGEDMDAFQDDNIKAAREYARRRRKGIPSDRWADGAKGEAAVASGIDGLDWCLAWSVNEIERLRAENAELRAQIKRSGADAMEPHKDPMR